MASPKVDYALPTPPGDGVSDITFSPNGTLLTAGSWDNGVRSTTRVNRMLSGVWLSQQASNQLTVRHFHSADNFEELSRSSPASVGSCGLAEAYMGHLRVLWIVFDFPPHSSSIFTTAVPVVTFQRVLAHPCWLCSTFRHCYRQQLHCVAVWLGPQTMHAYRRYKLRSQQLS